MALSDVLETKRKSKFRWLIAITLCLSNIGNSMIWIGFAPITDLVASHYETSALGVLMLANIFIIVMTIFGIPTIWLMDQLGIRQNITISVILNLLASILRLFSSIGFISPRIGYIIVFVAQTIASFSQLFSLFITSRLSNEWFPPNERAFANTVTTLSCAIGSVSISLISPIVVTKDSVNMRNDMLKLHIVVAAPNICSFFGIILFRLNKHKKFENESTNDENDLQLPSSTSTAAVGKCQRFNEKWISFKKFNVEIIQSLKNKAFLLLIIAFSTNGILYFSTGTIISILLCPRGYSNAVAGWCNSLLFGVGIITTMILSYIIGRIGRLVEIIKISFLLAVFSFIGFYVSVIFYANSFWLLLTIFFCSIFALPGLSLSLEMGVECTYPLSETQSTGVLWIITMTASFIYMTIFEAVAPPLTTNLDKSTCDAGVVPKDYTWLCVGMLIVALVISILTLIFLKSPYLRRKAEEIEKK